MSLALGVSAADGGGDVTSPWEEILEGPGIGMPVVAEQADTEGGERARVKTVINFRADRNVLCRHP